MNMSRMKITLIVNESEVEIEVEAGQTLADLLREQLGLTGTKVSCGEGECGSCTVILDNKAVNSCLVPAAELSGTRVTTIEGLASSGELDPLQEAFLKEGAVQCGFCTPGMIMSAKALLLTNSSPNEHDIRRALAGNLCRCTGYHRIIKAVKVAANALTELQDS